MKKIILFLCVLATAVSCIKLEEITVKDIQLEKVSFNTMTNISLDLVLTVENVNKKKIIIDNAELDMWVGEVYVGLIETAEKVTLTPQFNGKVTLPLQVSITNLSALTSIGSNMENMLDQFEVTGFVKIKTGAFTKKHKVTKTTIKNLFKNL
jgi:LEA14-like dessication related protein